MQIIEKIKTKALRIMIRLHHTYLKPIMSMYNLLEYSGNYSLALGSLWSYFRDEMNDGGQQVDLLNVRQK